MYVHIYIYIYTVCRDIYIYIHIYTIQYTHTLYVLVPFGQQMYNGWIVGQAAGLYPLACFTHSQGTASTPNIIQSFMRRSYGVQVFQHRLVICRRNWDSLRETLPLIARLFTYVYLLAQEFLTQKLQRRKQMHSVYTMHQDQSNKSHNHTWGGSNCTRIHVSLCILRLAQLVSNQVHENDSSLCLLVCA